MIDEKEIALLRAAISHDMRAPLRAISGFSKILEEDYRDALGEEGKRILTIMRNNAEKMNKMVEGLVLFLQIGIEPIARETVGMEKIVRDIVGRLTREQPDRTIDFVIHPLPSANISPLLFRYAISELVSNAIQFTAEQEKARIEIGCRKEEDRWVYFIKDNGMGFDMKYKNKLFGFFQHLHVGKSSGVGLGLALVKKIVERHDGVVFAEGIPNQGATFYFTIGKQEKPQTVPTAPPMSGGDSPWNQSHIQ